MRKIAVYFIYFLLIFRIPLEYFGNKIDIFNLTLDAFIFAIAFVIITFYLLTCKILNFVEKNTILLWLFIVISILSLFTSINFQLSITTVSSNIFNILVFFLIFKVFKTKEIKGIIISTLIGLSIPTSDAYLQLLFGDTYYIKQGYETIRSSGLIFKLPAYSAATMEFYLILYLVLYNYYINGKLYEKMQLKINKTILLYILVVLVGVFITGFRSAILVSLGFFLLLALFSGNITSKIKTLLFASFILVTSLFVYSNYNPGGFVLLKQAISLDYILNPDASVSTFASRLDYMNKYLFNFTLPIFGYGGRTFGIINSISDSGSLYVNLWFSYGALGFFIFILFLLKLLKDNFFNKEKVFINSYLVIVILCALVSGLSETTLLGTRGLYFFVILGIICNCINRYKYNIRRSNVYIGNYSYKK